MIDILHELYDMGPTIICQLELTSNFENNVK